MPRLALQARLCYNQEVNIVGSEDAANISRLVANLYRRSTTVNTLSSSASNGNLEKRCTGPCGRLLPATLEFFHAAKKGKYGLTATCKECKSEYAKEYESRPEVRQSRREYKREHYNSHPEVRTHKQEYHKEYYARPEVQEHRKAYQGEYYKRPEVQEHNREWHKAYFSRPEVAQHVQERQKTYRARPDIREHDKAYQSCPEAKASRHKYNRRLEVQRRKQRYNQTYYKAYSSRPEVKQHLQEYRALPTSKARFRTIQHNRRARKSAVGGTHTPEQIREQYDRQKGKCYYCQHKVKWGEHHIEHVIPISRGGSNNISNIVLSCPGCNWRKGSKLPHEWPEGGRLL